MGRAEHTNEELVSVLKAKGCALSARVEAALLLIPRGLFVPKDRHREAFRDQKLTVRMADGSIMTLPPPSFVVRVCVCVFVGFLGSCCQAPHT
jgi:protein-L-isoaspartate O-methyltransferase